MKPDPLLALGKKPVVAGGALPSLSQGLVTGSPLVQVVTVIVVVPRRAQQLECQVT